MSDFLDFTIKEETLSYLYPIQLFFSKNYTFDLNSRLLAQQYFILPLLKEYYISNISV